MKSKLTFGLFFGIITIPKSKCSLGCTSNAHIGASKAKHQATSDLAFGKSRGYFLLVPVSEKNATFNLIFLSIRRSYSDKFHQA